jgi:exoribonuclease R
MLLYNREAAKRLREAGQGILRRHAAPDQARFDAYAALGLPANQLALAAGEYCDAAAAADEIRHWGLGEAVYCHATSPIRRWADALNQLVLLGAAESIPFGDSVEQLNRRAKAAKAYERDVAFARLLLGEDTKPAEWMGVVVEPGRIWVPTWGRLQRADTEGQEPGQAVRFRVYCDATQKNWKRRLIVRIL